jgi:hypothetical protein
VHRWIHSCTGRAPSGEDPKWCRSTCGTRYPRAVQKLKNGVWKDVVQKLQETNVNGEIVTKRGEFFSEFQQALNNVPEHSKHVVTQAFFEKVIDKFIAHFKSNLHDHLLGAVFALVKTCKHAHVTHFLRRVDFSCKCSHISFFIHTFPWLTCHINSKNM